MHIYICVCVCVCVCMLNHMLLFFIKMLSVSPLAIIKVSYNNTIGIRIVVKECMTKPLDVTHDFL
jgi:hypothetical protein